MKYIPQIATCLILILYANGMFVCAQNPCGPPGNVIVAPEPKKKALEGEVISFFSNGNMKSKLYYKSNHLDGIQFYYHLNGKLRSKTTYRIGIMHGPFQEYYDNGNLQMEGMFQYNKKDGPFTNYNQQGIKLIEGKYVADNINEQYKYFYENGQVAYSLLYKDGKLVQDGETKIYYPDGKIKRIEIYKAGERKGVWKSYYNNGKLWEEAVNNKKHGPGSLIEYHTNGNIKSIVHFYLDPNISNPLTDNILLQGAKLIFNDKEEPIRKEEYFKNNLLRVTDLDVGLKSKWKLVFPKIEYGGSLYDSLKIIPSAEGEFTDGVYHFNSISDRNGKKLLRGGNGNYYGPYCLVNDPGAFADIILVNERYSFEEYYMSGAFHLDWMPLNNIGVRARYETDRSTYVNDYLTLAKGKFKNGLKEGEWLEGNFFEMKRNRVPINDGPISSDIRDLRIVLESPENCYAQGNYIKGKKEGLWKLHNADVTFEGFYKDGKRVGKWKTHKRNYDSKYKSEQYYYSDNFRCFVEGQYKNGLPDSVWTIFIDHSDTVQQQQLYINGLSLGVIKEYYISGKIKMKGILSGDTLIRKYYSPLGDELKSFKYGSDSYCETKNGKRDGKYYSWEYNGRITHTGYYLNGNQEGPWLEFGYDGDTIAMYQYRNGLLEGNYMKKEYGGVTEGKYNMNQKEGAWVEFNYNSKRISNYKNGKEQLLNYWESEKHLIKEGEGILTTVFDSYSSDPYTTKKKEVGFKKGFIHYYKEYYKNGSLKLLKYVTPRGDSLAVHNSPFGGLCVSSGEGVVTEYDDNNRIEQVHFYEGGRLQKTEQYHRGNYSSVKIFFTSKYEKQPVIKRKFIKVSEGVYAVEVTINELFNASNFQKLIEKLPGGYQVTLKEELSASTSYKFKEGELIFIWTNNSTTDFSIVYTLKIPKNYKFIPDYEGQFEYVIEGHKVVVQITEPNIIY